MSTSKRVTVTLPADLIEDIDRRESNRNRFVLEAVRRELERRRREDLRRSVGSPHSQTSERVELGLQDWARSLPADDAGELVDLTSGKAVSWTPGKGWAEVEE